MDYRIGIGNLSAHSVIVFRNRFTKAFGLKRIFLSSTDSDAIPFGTFPVFKANGDWKYKFYVGKKGTTHRSLLETAIRDNQRLLGKDWLHNPQYSSLVSQFRICSAGRIWLTKHYIIMRDNLTCPDVVKYVINKLNECGICCNNFQILYSENNYNIHLCNVEDYLNGCANQYGYKAKDDF